MERKKGVVQAALNRPNNPNYAFIEHLDAASTSTLLSNKQA